MGTFPASDRQLRLVYFFVQSRAPQGSILLDIAKQTRRIQFWQAGSAILGLHELHVGNPID
jgi:hypothetical protein